MTKHQEELLEALKQDALKFLLRVELWEKALADIKKNTPKKDPEPDTLDGDMQVITKRIKKIEKEFTSFLTDLKPEKLTRIEERLLEENRRKIPKKYLRSLTKK